MPLLKRKAFEKAKVSEYLRDDDEVFHCEITDEIFKDYEEYCERIILVNSMVWSCKMTGKNNLTYSEALDSEKAARRSLKDFPMELRIPILYLAAKTKRSSFADMAEDVFNFVRERFFVGEMVEACLEGDSWAEAHVLSVTSTNQQPGSTAIRPPTAYCYEVEQFAEDGSEGTIGTAPHDRMRRPKGVFSRDKCRLFLKQFVEMGIGGIISIKKEALEKYNIAKVMFDQIFTGSPPEFPSSKKLMKNSMSPANKSLTKPGSAKKNTKKLTPDKKGKQQSMDKFVKKTDNGSATKKPDPQSKKNNQELMDKMRKAEEQMRQRKEEEKAKKKEKSAKLQAYIKEWQKVKDDLELEDHKVLPQGTPIDIEGIPQTHIGDFLAVLEFVHLYSETLKSKDVFPHGLDVELFRKALVVRENAGVFSDLIQMMLTTIFSLQEDEAEEYNENGRIAESTEEKVSEGEVGTGKAIELATRASKWSQTYLGTALSKLHLDATTVTEVLRLHLLSSGAEGNGKCAVWRYQQRGGYSSMDDPAIRLRVHSPQTIARLANRHVAQLSLQDKFSILQCLMNQIMSYATVRDIIEDRIESYKTMKHELRTMQIQERKREMEFMATRAKMRKEAAAKKETQKLKGEAAIAVDKELADALEKLVKESETKRAAYLKKQQQMHADCFQHVSCLGMDRAYRRYWVNQATGGMFVEAGDENRGPCLDKPVRPANTDREGDTLAYLTKLFESEIGGSDKENDSGANSRGNSAKKPLSNLNGLSHKLNGLEADIQQMKDLLVCTGDVVTCFVHGKGDFRPQWSVYNTEEQLEELLKALNKRGVRESDLRQAIEADKPSLIDIMKKCPLYSLNSVFGQPPPVTSSRRKYQPSLTVPADSTVGEALELELRDYILELEEKIHHGCLGHVKVKDREAWRGTIMLRGYDKQAEYLTWGPGRQYRDDWHLPNGVLKAPPDSETPVAEMKYRDPGHYLCETPRVNGLNGVKVKDEEEQGVDVVRGLASALLQVEQGIHHKYLRRPLGLDDKERKEREAKGKSLDMEALERWEVSLMESRSFAQVVLHLFSLDSSITWSASILNASCRICRRKTDPDNMLLCDSCNKGHHLYCLKPKLTKVPEGDWFCDSCKPKEQKTPRKKRKLFSEEDIEEAMEQESEEEGAVDLGLCATCGSGGRLAAICVSCSQQFHSECAQPPPGRGTRRWQCATCKDPPRDSDESDDNTALVSLKTKRGRHSKETSPMVNGHENGHAKKSRRSREDANKSSSKRSRTSANTSLTNGTHESGRKRSSRHEPALHKEAFEELLRDVMKHKDCWPFYEPVSLDDVPDYLEVITTPMDFTTVKEKLEGGQYKRDADVIDDVTQIFVNCFTYNQDTHPVAKAGIRLEKYFNKRCTDLDLPTLPDINLEDDAANRRPSVEEPKAKRMKK